MDIATWDRLKQNPELLAELEKDDTLNDIEYVAGRQVVQQHVKIALGNLYLYHVIAYVRGIKVINTAGEEEEASERIMRALEEQGGIKEMDVNDFRVKIVAQLRSYRMDALYDVLGFVFEYAAETDGDVVSEWLAQYPNILPLAL